MYPKWLFEVVLKFCSYKKKFSILSYKALEISNSMSNSLNQTLFNKYSDILQPLQIYQVGEYPYVKIHNVVGTKIPVKNWKEKFKMLLQNLLSCDCF